jgi:hypothetical protein
MSAPLRHGAAMTIDRPGVTVLGSLSPEAQQDLASDVELVPDAQQAQAILVDGSLSAIDEARLTQALASKPVVIVKPTAAQLATIGKLTGVGVGDAMDAIAVVRGASGEYRTAVSSRGSAQPIADDDAPVAAGGGASAAPSVAALLQHVAPPPLLRAGFPDMLIPLEGAQFGRTQLSFSGSANPPQIVPRESRSWASRFQYNTVSANFDVYVYWVDGESPPYYRVIIRQQVTFSPGRVTANVDHTRGFLQCLGRSSLSRVEASSGGRLRLEARSPSTGEAESQIGGQMVLIANVQGGMGPTIFNYSASGPVGAGGSSGWTVAAGVAPGLPDWIFHATTPWNPQQNPDLRDWNIFYEGTSRKPQSEMIKPFPAQCASEYVATTFAVYRLDGPRTPMVLTFSFEYYHQLLFLLTPPGSNTSQYAMRRPASMFFSPRFSLDLAQIAPITR